MINLYSNLLKAITAIILTLSLGLHTAFAIPADPRPKSFVQPDGSVLTVKIRGDEHSHFYLTEDDYLLVEKDGAFCYGNVDPSGKIVSSGILAKQIGQRSVSDSRFLADVNMDKVFTALADLDATRELCTPPVLRGPGLFSGSNFPCRGDQKVLVLLVEYTDVKFNLEDPYDYFSRMLSEEGFSDYNGTGSAYDYFVQNSMGEFRPDFDVYGPVTLPYNMAYYGSNNSWGNDERAYQMVIHACEILDEEVDFSQYDCDGDGFVDNVYVFYAGDGEASGGSANTVWPHSWNILRSLGETHIFDEVTLDRYACSNEWESGVPDGIGTFVHEFSHVLGLPDLYSTSYSSSFTPGAWSVLDVGPYNNNGRTPPNYSIFERYALSWMTPEEFDCPETYYLAPITENVGYIIPTASINEFFLIENRQKTGWDAFIPGHGMLIWHIDYKSSVWNSNKVNNTPSHQYVDLEEADNKQTDFTRSGDSFPGTSGVTSFTATTTPGMVTWDGTPIDMPLTAITESDGIISFMVSGGRNPLSKVSVSESFDVKDMSFSIAWEKDEMATSYLVSVYTKDAEGLPVYHSKWNKHEVGDVLSASILDVDPLTTYYVVVASYNGVHTGEPSDEFAVTTAVPTLAALAPVVSDATDVEKDSFVANWELLPEADSYYLSVYTKGESYFTSDVVDFLGGLSKLPEGWSVASKVTYSNPDYCGEAVPSLRLSAKDNYVESPLYDSDIISLSFWHRASAASDNYIKVLAEVDGDYVEVAEFKVVSTKGGKKCTVSDFPPFSRRVKILYAPVVESTNLAIDDIQLDWGYTVPKTMVGDFDSLNVGNVNSCKVDNLLPETVYYYSVSASNPEFVSKISQEMMVTTQTDAGIADAVTRQDIVVRVNDIIVHSLPLAIVELYSSDGRLLAAARTSADGVVSIPKPSSGVYVVRCGNSALTLKI